MQEPHFTNLYDMALSTFPELLAVLPFLVEGNKTTRSIQGAIPLPEPQVWQKFYGAAKVYTRLYLDFENESKIHAAIVQRRICLSPHQLCFFQADLLLEIHHFRRHVAGERVVLCEDASSSISHL